MVYANLLLEKKQIKCIIIMFILLSGGCSSSILHESSQPSRMPGNILDNDNYKKFVIENLEILDQIYSDSYVECEYLVKTDYGIKTVQTLIDPEATRVLLNNLKTDKLLKHELIMICFHYVLNYFKYFPSPDTWPSVDLTIKLKKGDCKGLSLLLISMLQLLDIDCYGAVNNGHMWVEAFNDDNWLILETDSDKKRNSIYQLKGFYDKPMFRIHINRSEKRIRKQKLIQFNEQIF